ncbi:MAG: hypothetical protein WCE30_10150 [Mycobacterium sp.]
MTDNFGRRAQLDSHGRSGIVVQDGHDGSVLIRWDNDNTATGLSWHKVISREGPAGIVVHSEATPTMHQVAQTARHAAMPPLIGGVPA